MLIEAPRLGRTFAFSQRDASFVLGVPLVASRPLNIVLGAGRKFAEDGSLTLILSSDECEDEAGKANWLPTPNDQFAPIVRTYVPTAPILNGSYKLPDVERAR
ncbi:DUF1214 domain-containing protein [Microvirga brassicacearum]|uniref:DUF1214 domain-containing protein n=2 Tax=Microvirga brassicacearum TaxID=2580413 RepID=A0A5N3PAH1_9HYPH|nr:DUF1214 domain-containing protein [Microvirga brassicacearum]